MKKIFSILFLMGCLATTSLQAAQNSCYTQIAAGDTIAYTNTDATLGSSAGKWMYLDYDHETGGNARVNLHIAAQGPLNKPQSIDFLWIVEGVEDGSGNLIPDQVSLFNYGYMQRFGRKLYLGMIYYPEGGVHATVATNKMVLTKDRDGLYQMLSKTDGTGVMTKMYLDAGGAVTNDRSKNAMTWPTNSITWPNRIIKYRRVHQEIAYAQIDDNILFKADGSQEFSLGFDNEVHTFHLPYRLQFEGVVFEYQRDEGNNIYNHVDNVNSDGAFDLVVENRNICDCDPLAPAGVASCEAATLNNVHWANGSLAPNSDSVSVSGHTVTLHTRHRPMNPQQQPLRDTLLATASYMGINFNICLPLEQATGYYESSAIDIWFEPGDTVVENTAQSIDYELKAVVTHGRVLRRTDLPNQAVSSEAEELVDTVVTLTQSNVSLTGSELCRNWTYTIHDKNHVTVTIDQSQSATTNPMARLKCMFVYKTEYDACQSIIVQRVKDVHDIEFDHKRGHTDRHLQANGMQAVHELKQIIYMKPGSSQVLQPAEGKYKGYFRWFDYDTDRQSNHITIDRNWQLWNNDFGSFRVGGLLENNSVTYTMPADFAKGQVERVACDISAYSDFTFDQANNIIIEPTLSQRMIFEIHHAGEMADTLTKCVGDKFLEEYHIFAGDCNDIFLAPRLRQQNGVCDYWFWNGNVFDGTLSQINTVKWYKNGVELTGGNLQAVAGGHYIRVHGTAGDTTVYTMESNGYKVAKFTVQYKSCREIGPLQENVATLKTDADILENYMILKKLDFDFDVPGTYIATSYDVPLQPEESSYGFAYADYTNPQGNRNSNARFARVFPYYGEYAFINTTAGWQGIDWLAQLHNRTGRSNGYFLICDGTAVAGRAVSLDLESSLCAGSQMFCSAWVAAANTTDIKPVLQFEVVGIDAQGVEHSLSTFTTGELTLNAGWQQVNFPIETNTDYPSYRMHITNHSAGNNGNDFAVDEITVYASETSITSQQVNTVCAAEDDQTIAISTRIDYETLPFLDRANYKVYYQWYNATMDTIIKAQYIDVTGLEPEGARYGCAILPSPDYEIPAEMIYSSEQLLLESFAENPVANKFGYVQEDIMGETRYVFYGVDLIEAEKNEWVVLRLAYSPEELGNTMCALSREILILPRAQLLLNGEIVAEDVSTICANQTHTLSMRVYDSSDNESGCLTDWLKGVPRDSTDAKNREIYGYTWREINEAIYDLRHPKLLDDLSPNPNLVIGNVDAIYTEFLSNTGGNGKPKTIDVIGTLVRRGLLDLAAGNQTIVMTNGDNIPEYEFSRMVFPIDGTSPEGIVICEEPIIAKFELCKLEGYQFDLGYGSEKDDLGGRVRGVRAYNDVDEFLVRVKASNMVKLDTIQLVETDDPNFRADMHHIILTPSRSDYTHFDPMYAELQLTIDKENSNYEMREGYTYTFGIKLVDFNGVAMPGSSSGVYCPVGYTYFDVHIVPKIAIWTPEGQSTAWNNDRNWRTGDRDGNILNSGFVPMEKTNVLIPNFGLSGYYPVLHTDVVVGENQYLPVENGAMPFATYDFNYQSNTCDTIHFSHYATMVNHHVLNYNYALSVFRTFQMRWHMYGVPFKGVVSGDFYTPADRYVDAGFFTAGDSDPARRTNTFFLSVFNQNAANQSEQGYSENISSATWTTPTNSMNMPIPAGSGFALWTYTHNGDVINEEYDYNPVRLPKANDKYFYNYSDGRPSEFFEAVERPADYGRFAFEPEIVDGDTVFTVTLTNKEPGRLFLFGNPVLAAIDARAALEFNKDDFTGTYYHIPEEVCSDQLDMTVCTRFTPDLSDMLLKPYHGILLETKEIRTSVQVKLKPSMLHLYRDLLEIDIPDVLPPGDAADLDDPGIHVDPEDPIIEVLNPVARKRDTKRISERNNLSLMSIMAEFNKNDATYYTTVELGETPHASNDFVRGEDAEIVTFTGAENYIDNALAHTVLYAKNNDKALAVNILSELQSVPLSYTCVDGEPVETFSLWFSGISNFDHGMQLYDSKREITIPIYDGMRLTLEGTASDEVRYYIQCLGYNNSHVVTGFDNQSTTQIAAFTQPNKMVHVVASEPLTKITVFTATGQTVLEKDNLSRPTAEFALPQGAYILKIETSSGENGIRKIIVK